MVKASDKRDVSTLAYAVPAKMRLRVAAFLRSTLIWLSAVIAVFCLSFIVRDQFTTERSCTLIDTSRTRFGPHVMIRIEHANLRIIEKDVDILGDQINVNLLLLFFVASTIGALALIIPSRLRHLQTAQRSQTNP